MERKDNYQIQARQAQDRFLTYDQEGILRKLRLRSDEDYLYVPMLSQTYRISRTTGGMARNVGGTWVESNSHSEVMTLLDLLCDSREDRFLRRQWKNMSAFGLMFHQSLAESSRDPWAQLFQARPEDFCRACEALHGRPLLTGDISYAIELFDGLEIALQLWFGDEEFPPNLRFLWDENALMYIKYETMYFARGLLLSRIKEQMDRT